MNELFEIIKYTVPSIIVFGTAYFMLLSFFKRENEKSRTELILNNQKLITPIRLQAYERAILFLERISPELLLQRVKLPKMSAKELQLEMLNSIRKEYEHNLSQQLYMTNEAWQAVVNAKESIIQLINVAANRLNNDASAIDLSKIILDMFMNVEHTPVRNSINFIKEETHHFMDNKPLYYSENK